MGKTIAFIPVRGGSKSIPLKNIKPLNGKPMVYWAVKAAVDSSGIDEVYVCTDSKEIAETVSGFGFSKVKIVGRSEESASDMATTESVMLEFSKTAEFDHIILIQATSPLIESKDLDRGLEVYAGEEVDSVLSVVRQKRFIWVSASDGSEEYMKPLNYKVEERPRRQEFDGFFVENGAFYITSKKDLEQSGCRISGNIKAVEMDETAYFEIDEPSDWIIVEQLMIQRERKSPKRRIKMFLTDCDGVLTDGGMYYSETGDEMKRFDTRDGMGMQFLRERGIITGIITGEDRELVKNRAFKLKLDIIRVGIVDKWKVVREIAEEYGIKADEIAYIGDDLNDLECIRNCGFSACPADAVEQVKQNCSYVCAAPGGHGAVREAAEKIIGWLT